VVAVARDEQTVARFNTYARMGPKTLGLDPLLIRVSFTADRFRGSP